MILMTSRKYVISCPAGHVQTMHSSGYCGETGCNQIAFYEYTDGAHTDGIRHKIYFDIPGVCASCDELQAPDGDYLCEPCRDLESLGALDKQEDP